MTYKTTYEGDNWKFERSGFFGTGSKIKAYKNGAFYQEFDVTEFGGEAEFLSKRSYFESMCDIWCRSLPIKW